MLAPLDNETIFKQAFTDKTVFAKIVKYTGLSEKEIADL